MVVVKPKRVARRFLWTLALPVAGTTGPRHGPRPSVAETMGTESVGIKSSDFWTPQLATKTTWKGSLSCRCFNCF